MRSAAGRLMHCGVLTLALGVSVVNAQVRPDAENPFSWGRATAEEMGMDVAKLHQAREYATFDRADPHEGGSGFITRRGKLVLAWGSSTHLYQVKSATKAIGVTALGVAMQDGRVSLSDRAKRFHPRLGLPPDSNAATGWLDTITILQLATQTAGFDRGHGFERLLFEPGTRWAYTDGGPNWLAECLTLEYRQDMKALLIDRVFSPLGITEADLTWRDSYYRPDLIEGIKRREFGSGIRANMEALARIGYLYLAGGVWQGRQIVPKAFVEAVRTTPASVRGVPSHRTGSPGASNHYGLFWWNNDDGAMPGVPRDAFWAWGGMQGRDTETLIVVIPSLEIVVARSGSGWGDGTIDYKFLTPFIAPIAESVASRPRS
jgi:CubicO group peptidase (beta-lactamase class C family)